MSDSFPDANNIKWYLTSTSGNQFNKNILLLKGQLQQQISVIMLPVAVTSPEATSFVDRLECEDEDDKLTDSPPDHC